MIEDLVLCLSVFALGLGLGRLCRALAFRRLVDRIVGGECDNER